MGNAGEERAAGEGVVAALGPIAWLAWLSRARLGTPVVVLAALAVAAGALLFTTKRGDRRVARRLGRALSGAYAVAWPLYTAWIVQSGAIPLRHLESIAYQPMTATAVGTYRALFDEGLERVEVLRGGGFAFRDRFAWLRFEASAPPTPTSRWSWAPASATEVSSYLRARRLFLDEPALGSATLSCQRAEPSGGLAIVCYDPVLAVVLAHQMTH